MVLRRKALNSGASVGRPRVIGNAALSSMLIIRRVRRFLAETDGPTAVEYAIMLALIITVCMVSITKTWQPLEPYVQADGSLNTQR